MPFAASFVTGWIVSWVESGQRNDKPYHFPISVWISPLIGDLNLVTGSEMGSHVMQLLRKILREEEMLLGFMGNEPRYQQEKSSGQEAVGPVSYWGLHGECRIYTAIRALAEEAHDVSFPLCSAVAWGPVL